MLTPLFADGTYASNAHAWPLLAVGAAIALLGVGVLVRERGSRIGVSFLLLCISIGIYLVATALNYLSRDDALSLTWIRISQIGTVFIPSTVWLLTASRLGLYHRYRRVTAAALTGSLLFAAAALATDWHVRGSTRYFWGSFVRYGPVGVVFVACFLGMMLAVLLAFRSAYRGAAEPEEARRLRYLLVALGGGFVGAVDFLPALGIGVYPFGFLPILFFLVMSAYVVIRHNLVEITPQLAAGDILETMLSAVLVADLRGTIRLCNRASEAMTGYGKTELLGRPLQEVLSLPLDFAAAGQTGERSVTWEGSFTSGRGKRCDAIVSASRLVGSGKAAVGTVYVLHDVAERRQAEAALRLSEERLRAAVIVSRIGIFDHDQRTDTIYWSPQQRAIHGWGPDEPVALASFLKLLHPSDREWVSAAVARAHDPAGDGIWDVEHRIVRRDGCVRWLKERSQTFFEEEGGVRGPVRTIGAVLDITEQKETEEALRESENRFRSVFDGAKDGIALLDVATGRFVMGNRSLCSMLGLGESELPSMRVEDIHPPDVLPLVRSLLAQGARGDVTTGQPIPVRRKDGSVFLADISGSVASLAGKSYVVGVFRDVTDQRLALSEQRKLASIIEASADLVGVADLDGRLQYLNSAGLRLVGLDSLGEARGRPVRDFHFEEDHGRLETEIIPSIRDSGSWRGEIAYRHFGTGAPVPVEMNGFLIRDSTTGGPIAIANISRDTSERRRAEEERQKLQTQLLQAQKMESIGQLAGGIAHDFNNILAAIVGYANVLQMEVSDGHPIRDDLGQILEAARRGTQLTHSLLAFSRKQVMNMRPRHLNEIVARQEGFLRRIIGEDIHLTTALASDPVVMVDSSQIEQVLMNLAANARDAMPRGGSLTFETGLFQATPEIVEPSGFGSAGSYAVLTVTDTGIGMSAETRRRIFEPFFTTKEVGKGTGLGLAIVYGIVKQHRGHVSVSSEIGKGTTFRIYLPLHQGDIEERPAPAVAAGTMTGSETILLAEDDPALCGLFRDVLTKFGYTVVTAQDGERAIAEFAAHRDQIALSVIDVIMPKKSGREVYEAIQEMRPGAKVIFSSGYTADKVRQEQLPPGTEFIGKPAPPQVILRKVRDLLDGPRLETRGGPQ